MLDPKEQAKGGFRARAEREKERKDALAASGEPEAPAEAGDGSAGDDTSADGERSPYAPPARRPKNWR